MKEVRLFFEPKTGTNVNHDLMFKHYVENWLSDIGGEYSGSISMDCMKKVHGAFEPVYQWILKDVSDTRLMYLRDYITRNPLHGYHSHLYTQKLNHNLEHQGVYS